MHRNRRILPQFDAVTLEETALSYVARFATTRAKLEDYLRRKLRERGWSGADEPPVAALAERFVSAGYIDDEAYARAKAGSLLRRGYGMRRVDQALGHAGIDGAVRESIAPGEGARREAALAMARKRRFGPFANASADPAQDPRKLREKQVAAMLRAGHSLDHVRALLDAATAEAAEQWALEGQSEE